MHIGPNKKIANQSNNQAEHQTVGQRAFLNESQDSLELSTRGNKSVSFGSSVNKVIKNFLGDKPQIASTKAVKMLKDNGIVDENYKPEESIATKDYNNLTDMPATFQ